jgi:hypothetical protein
MAGVGLPEDVEAGLVVVRGIETTECVRFGLRCCPRYLPLRYLPLRYLPLRYLPLRYLPLRYLPLRAPQRTGRN